LVASFAATTLDTATRLQRYVIQELAAGAKFKPLTNKYAATGLAVALGAAIYAHLLDAGGPIVTLTQAPPREWSLEIGRASCRERV